MIVIDTNVVSEAMKSSPSRSVIQWLNAQASSTLYVSTVTIGEIEYGLRVLPDGRRRLALKDRFEQFLAQAFSHRLLAYDEAAARAFGEVMGHRRELGRPTSIPDGQIAAIARVRGYAVATRNLGDFEHCGIDLIDPFVA